MNTKTTTKEQLRAAIAAAQDRETIKVEKGAIRGWDFDLWLTQLSGEDGNEISALFTKTKTEQGEGAANVAVCNLVLVRSITDDVGERLFGDDEIKLITSRGTEAVSFLTKKAMELNKLDKISQDTAVKTSGSDQTS